MPMNSRRRTPCRMFKMVSTIKEEKLSARAKHWPAGWRSVLCHTHTYSGRDDHGGPVKPPESYQRLADWAQRCGVDAIGMGSPYTPSSAQVYGRFDGKERDLYYSPTFDRRSVMATDEIERMLAEAR